MTNTSAKRKVSEEKIRTVKRLVELIKNNNTVMIASIKNLPSKQFQDIRKKLRTKAKVRVVKKRIMLKALDDSEKKIAALKRYVQENSAVLFSELDAFELAGFLAENKNPIKAKPGQTADKDIEVEEGPTDLIPGPVISEFGNLGVQIAVEDGKIAIKQKKVIAKQGEKIKEAAASIMAKLDIKPFEIGLEPLAIYDSKTGKIYTDIKIDKKKTAEELKTSAIKALGLAQKIVYYCKETIGCLLAKANADEKAISSLQQTEETKEQTKEEKAEKTENTDEKTGESEEERKNG